MDEIKVWVSSRKCRKRTSYHLRWIDAATGRWRSKAVGTDRKRVVREAVRLENELGNGTHRDLKRATWTTFTDDVVSYLQGAHATEARRTLDEFGDVCKPPSPKNVRPGMIREYVLYLRADHGDKCKGNAVSTVNKKLRYLRLAFRTAVDLDYAKTNPMRGWRWEREEKKPPRVLTDDEEKALLDAAETLYGFRWRALVQTAIRTGGRRGELLGLTWDRVDFDGARVHFTNTKSHRDRYVPLDGETVGILRRLQAQTLRYGGPFVGMADNLGREWGRIRQHAEVPDVSLHDCRRTCATRLIRAGVPLPTVQKIMGHADIKTTLEHYNWVSDDDMREAVNRVAELREAAG